MPRITLSLLAQAQQLPIASAHQAIDTNSSIASHCRLTDTRNASGTYRPAIASMAPDACAASNDDADSPGVDNPVNPLWMITIALGILVGVMALFVATT